MNLSMIGQTVTKEYRIMSTNKDGVRSDTMPYSRKAQALKDAKSLVTKGHTKVVVDMYIVNEAEGIYEWSNFISVPGGLKK